MPDASKEKIDSRTLEILRIARKNYGALKGRIVVDSSMESETTEGSESTEASETTENSESTEASENKEAKDTTEDSEGTENSENSEDTEASETTENSEDSENSEDTENDESLDMRILDIISQPAIDNILPSGFDKVSIENIVRHRMGFK